MNPGDPERIAEALQDESKSFRAIARELGVSDWAVRRVHRQLTGDDRPMRGARTNHGPPGGATAASGWWIFGSLLIGVALLIWISSRGIPPPEL